MSPIELQSNGPLFFDFIQQHEKRKENIVAKYVEGKYSQEAVNEMELGLSLPSFSLFHRNLQESEI